MPLRFFMLPHITVKPVQPQQAYELAALWHQSWHDGHADHLPKAIVDQRTPASFQERLKPLLPNTLAATLSGTTGGFATVLNDEVDQFFVARSMRGKGLAGPLLAAAEEKLAASGIRTGTIQCLAGNERALRFYARHGWRDTGIQSLPVWMPDNQEPHMAPTHLLQKRLG